MDDIQITTPDTIKYKDYMYFSPEEATAWVYDIVKYEKEVKHKDFISFSEYARIVRGFKEYLDNNGIKLLSQSELLNDKEIKFYQYIEKIWGLESEFDNINGDTAFKISEALVRHIPENFYYPYFEVLKDKQKVTIELDDYELTKLLKFDYYEIENVYNGQTLYAEGQSTKFYLDMYTKDEQLQYVRDFVKQQVVLEKAATIAWDVFNKQDECVALATLKINKDDNSATINLVLSGKDTSNNLAEVLKIIKAICFDTIGLSKVYAENHNKGFVYSALNTAYHFAGFKAKYEIDHATFEAETGEFPAIDEIYKNNKEIIENLFKD